jgi:hypothetical protein
MYDTGDSEEMQWFSGAFAKLEESFVTPVCPTAFIHMEQFDSPCKDVCDFLYWILLLKFVENIKFWLI